MVKSFMKKMFRSTKLVAGLLAVTMVLSACSAPFGDKAQTPHQQGKFSEIEYARPDVEQLYSTIDQALADTKAGNKQQETLESYEQILQMIVHYDFMQTVASVRSDINLSDTFYEEENTFLEQEYVKLDNKMLELTGVILDSSYAKAATKAWGQDFVERYERNSKLNSKAIEALSHRETDLVNEYKKLSTKEYTTMLNGKEVTINDLDFNDPNVATPYYEIYEKRNKELGEIYRELLGVRREIAQMLNFDSYTDYAYACLGRDFSKEEAKAFSEKVKKNLSPVIRAIEEKYGADMNDAQSRITATFEQGIPTLQDSLQSGYPKGMQEALTYMLENEMCIYSDDANTLPGAYCTILGEYRAPVMLVNTSIYSNPSTVFHEFGHYYNFYLMDTPSWGDGNNLDMAEIHSQGLELLMHEAYPTLYGEEAEMLAHLNLYTILSSILQGCAEDEFQQKAMENPEMSLEDLNLLHAEIYEEYIGYPVVYEWVDITHHFETPFYYISYATSAVSATEIWQIAQQDHKKALKTYDKITQYGLNCAYREPLRESGLSDPFTSDYIETLAQALSKEFKLDAIEPAA